MMYLVFALPADSQLAIDLRQDDRGTTLHGKTAWIEVDAPSARDAIIIGGDTQYDLSFPVSD